MSDAFTEQPSLQAGGGAAAGAPLELLRALSVGLLRARLGDAGDARAEALLGPPFADTAGRLRRLRAAAQALRAGRRSGAGRAPFRRLGLDRDVRQALRDGLRGAAAVSAVNAFWYFSDWPSGGTAVTWTALLSVLNASRPNPARFTLN